MFAGALDRPARAALDRLKPWPPLARFYLAGGTAAAIQLGHRVSVDLDYFTEQAFEPDQLLPSLDATGIHAQDVVIQPGTFKCRIADARVSFFHYPYPLCASPVDFEGMRLAGLLDIGLMKMTAIAARGAKRDFVDLYFILRALGREELFDDFRRKFASAAFDPYHYARSLLFFEDADRDADPRMLASWDWAEIKRFFVHSVRLFKFP